MEYTEEELKRWYICSCLVCGWEGLSRDCAGGEYNQVGDYDDVLCPRYFEAGDYNPIVD